MAIDRNKIVAEAQKHIQKGNFKKAIAEYARIIREEPDDVRILMKIGDLQVRDGQPREAQRTYTEVADYYVANGFFLKAVAVYKQILQLNPASVEPRVQLAELYFQLGLLSDSLTQYQQVAQTHQQNNQAALYVKTLERMVEVDPGHVGNRIKLAETLAKAGSSMSAAIHFASAARVLHAAGRFEEYVKVAERYLHLLPDDPDVTRELVRTLIQTDKALQAIQRIQPFLRREKVAIEDVDLVAEALHRLQERQRAVELLRELAHEAEGRGFAEVRDHCLRRLLEFDPNDEAARRTLGMAVNEEVPDLDDDAFEVLDAPDVAGDDPARTERVEQLLAESEIFARYNLHERLIDHLNQVFAIDPENAPALEKRARALIALGRSQEAAGTLTRLAAAVAPAGREQALAHLDEALTLMPGFPAAVHLRGTLGSDVLSMTLQPVPASELRPPTPAPVEEIVPERGSLDELDSLFAAFDVPQDDHAGDASLDQDQSFLRHIAEVDGAAADDSMQRQVGIATAPAVPPELEAAFDRVDSLVNANRIADAQTLLLNLTGEFPEFADRLLARMDMLPVVSSVDIAATSAPRPIEESDHPLFRKETTQPGLAHSSATIRVTEAAVVEAHPDPAPEASALDTASDAEPEDLFLDPDDDADIALEEPADEHDHASAPGPEAVETDADVAIFEVLGDSGLPLATDAEPSQQPGLEAAPHFDEESEAFLAEADADDSALPVAVDDEAEETVPPVRPPGTSGAHESAAPAPAPPVALGPPVVEVVVAADFDEPSGLLAFTPAPPPPAPRLYDAPVGRVSADADAHFGPTARALLADPGGALAQGVELRRDGSAFAAIDALQGEIFGDFPLAAQFELAAANIDMGMFFDGVQGMHELLNAPSLDETDRATIHYYLGIAYEALAQTEEALEHFARVREGALQRFPDVMQRIARL